MRRLLLFACVGCSFIFDPNAPDIQLVGKAPPPPDVPRVTIGDGEVFHVITGVDGDPWVLVFESHLGTDGFEAFWPPSGALDQLRLGRLTAPAQEELLTADGILGYDQRLYITHRKGGTVDLRTRLIGAPGEARFSFADDGARFDFSRDVFYRWGADTLELYRADGTFSRTAPAPTMQLLLAQFVDDDRFLLDLQGCGPSPSCVSIVAHSTTADSDFSLGTFDPPPLVEARDLLACDGGGLRRIPFDGSPPQVIDTDACGGIVVPVPGHLLECGTFGLVDHPLDGTPARLMGPCTNLSPMGFNGQPTAWQLTHRDDLSSQPTLLCGTPGILLAPADGSPVRVIDPLPCDQVGYALLDRVVLRCGDAGLRAVGYDGSTVTLDPGACSGIWSTGEDFALVPTSTGFALQLRQDDVWYSHGPLNGPFAALAAPLWSVPLDGSAPPRLLIEPDGKKRLLDRLGGAPPMYTLDSYDYAHPISDGWLGDWRFMERGLSLSISRDDTRLRWIDHAARRLPVGDLLTASLSQRDIVPLARNVRQYQEIAPGKLLVADAQPTVGPENRIILIDEAAKTARWVVSGADRFRYLFVNGEPRLIVELVSDANEKSLALLPPPLD